MFVTIVGDQTKFRVQTLTDKPEYEALRITHVCLGQGLTASQLYMEINRQEYLIVQLKKDRPFATIDITFDLADRVALYCKDGHVNVIGRYITTQKDYTYKFNMPLKDDGNKNTRSSLGVEQKKQKQKDKKKNQKQIKSQENKCKKSLLQELEEAEEDDSEQDQSYREEDSDSEEYSGQRENDGNEKHQSIPQKRKFGLKRDDPFEQNQKERATQKDTEQCEQLQQFKKPICKPSFYK